MSGNWRHERNAQFAMTLTQVKICGLLDLGFLDQDEGTAELT